MLDDCEQKEEEELIGDLELVAIEINPPITEEDLRLAELENLVLQKSP